MPIGNRFRCYPTPTQQQTLLQWIGCQRHIYNAKVGEDQYFRRFARKSLTHTGRYAPLDQQYGQFKTELTPWLFEVPSQVLRNGALLWKQAYSRYFSNLDRCLTTHPEHGKQSVWPTSELFEFTPVIDADTGEITGYQLHLGSQKFPIGNVLFKAHKDYQIPASSHVSIDAGRWHVSFNYDDNIAEPSDKDTTAWLMQFDAAELREMTVVLDRGVALPLAGSDQQRFDFSAIQKKRLSAQKRHKKRWQKRQGRRIQDSARWSKAKRKVSRYHRYGAEVRRDVAHKTSHTLAVDPRYTLFVFEALKVQNMTQKAKPKQDEQCVKKEQKRCGILKSKVGAEGLTPFYSSQECAA
jgi:putative transposase